MLEQAGNEELPTSSQPSPQEFFDIYKPLVDSGKEVLSFHISKGLSSTVDVAVSYTHLDVYKRQVVHWHKGARRFMGYLRCFDVPCV